MKKKLLRTFGGALLCAAVLLAVFAIKGIWPFGSGNVAYFDMGQAVLPYYYHIFDWLKGLNALNRDFFTGLGVNVAASGLPTPADLIILLFKRENLIYGIGFVFILKACISSVTAGIALEKIFPRLHPLINVALSAAYALSGYSLLYYTNIFWLDMVIIYPLVVYGAKKLLDEGKAIAYTIFYSFALMISYYQGYMLSLSVFFIGGLYLLTFVPEDLRGSRVLRLALGTVTGLLLSGWRFIPSALPALTSARLDMNSNGGGLVKSVLDAGIMAGVPTKLTLMLGVQFAAAACLFLFIRLIKQKEKRSVVFIIGALIIIFWQIPFEGTNIIWHGGPFIRFPARFFFVTVFIMICLGAAMLQNETDIVRVNERTKKVFTVLSVITAVLYAAVLFGTAVFYRNSLNGKIDPALTAAASAFSVLAVGTALFACVMLSGIKAKNAICLALTAVQAVAVGCATVANKYDIELMSTTMESTAFVSRSHEVEKMALERDPLERTANPDQSLNTNYPWITRTYALSNWTHVIPASLQDTAEALGFSRQYTRLIDQGGTAFTQSLLNIKEAIVMKNVDMPANYSLEETTENFARYRNVCPLGLGLLADDEIKTDITGTDPTEQFDLQNKIYSIFTDDDEQLLKICSVEKSDERLRLTNETKDKLIFEYVAGKDEILYLKSPKRSENYNDFKIYVNGIPIQAPYYMHEDETAYPTETFNGIISIGSFEEGETVTVELRGSFPEKEEVRLAYLSTDKLSRLNSVNGGAVKDVCIDKNKLSFSAENETGEEKYLFLPLAYDDGLSVTVNDEKAEAYRALGDLTAIIIPTGSSEIVMKYTCPGQNAGIIATLIGLLALAALLTAEKKDLKLPKAITKPIYRLFCVVYVAAFAAVYLLPAGNSLIRFIARMIGGQS